MKTHIPTKTTAIHETTKQTDHRPVPVCALRLFFSLQGFFRRFLESYLYYASPWKPLMLFCGLGWADVIWPCLDESGTRERTEVLVRVLTSRMLRWAQNCRVQAHGPLAKIFWKCLVWASEGGNIREFILTNERNHTLEP